MAKYIGIPTSGGDCPGLNAAIRGVGKAGIGHYERHHLDALVCLGGGGAQKNALRLKKARLKVVTAAEDDR